MTSDQTAAAAERRPARIRSFMETVEIRQVEEARASILDACFSGGEKLEVERRRAQTMAGFLAVKRSLAALFRELTNKEYAEKDFILGHEESGAPRIVGLPPDDIGRRALGEGRLKVSISHTKSRAYGVVVFQEGDDDG